MVFLLAGCATGGRPLVDAVAKRLDYVCAGGMRFTVFYGAYLAGDQQRKLDDAQLMLSDRQTHTVHLLTRTRSASGVKYEGQGLVFFAKGNQAMLQAGDAYRYKNCVVQK
jgi:membrane-bound inhibitor of C-type lysozyme